MHAATSFLFTTPKSEFHPNFWIECWGRKLSDWKLSTETIFITYRFVNDAFVFDEHSFEAAEAEKRGRKCAIINVNTIEDFKSINKKELLARVADPVWQDIGRGESDTLYETALILLYVDIKDHSFVYWFAAGTFKPESVEKDIFTPVASIKKLDTVLKVGPPPTK